MHETMSLSLRTRFQAWLFLLCLVVATHQAHAKPEIRIEPDKYASNCYTVVLINPPATNSVYRMLCVDRDTINAEIYVDKAGQQYVLVEYSIRQEHETFFFEGGGHLLILRPDRERLLQIAEFPLAGPVRAPGRTQYFWSTANTHQTGLELTLRDNSPDQSVFNILIVPGAEQTDGKILPRTKRKRPPSAFQTELIQLGGHYGSVPEGQGWCAPASDSVTLRVMLETKVSVEKKICPGYGYTGANANTLVDNTGKPYVTLEWVRRGTGPHDNLTLYRIEERQIVPILHIELSAEEIYGSDYVAEYAIDTNPMGGVRIRTFGSAATEPNCGNYCPPTERNYTFWINPE